MKLYVANRYDLGVWGGSSTNVRKRVVLSTASMVGGSHFYVAMTFLGVTLVSLLAMIIAMMLAFGSGSRKFDCLVRNRLTHRKKNRPSQTSSRPLSRPTFTPDMAKSQAVLGMERGSARATRVAQKNAET